MDVVNRSEAHEERTLANGIEGYNLGTKRHHTTPKSLCMSIIKFWFVIALTFIDSLGLFARGTVSKAQIYG